MGLRCGGGARRGRGNARSIGACRRRAERSAGRTSLHRGSSPRFAPSRSAATLASAAGVGFVAFLVTYSIDEGISEGAAGLLLGAVSLTATVSRVGLGLIADRSGKDPLRLTALILGASAVGYLLLIGGEPALIVVAALLVGSIGWSWPGTLTLAVVSRRPDAPAWAVGVMMSGLFAGRGGRPAAGRPARRPRSLRPRLVAVRRRSPSELPPRSR